MMDFEPQDWIGQIVTVVIDRPRGSRHPRFPDTVYPVDYGYVPGTVSGDGKPLDAYVLAEHAVGETFAGVCVAALVRRDNDDPKLVVAPAGTALADEAILRATDFMERWFLTDLVRGNIGTIDAAADASGDE